LAGLLCSGAWGIFQFQGAGEIAAGFGVSGIQSNGFLKLATSLVKPTFRKKDGAQISVCKCVLGIEADGLAELDDGIVETALGTQHRAEIVAAFGLIRSQTDRRVPANPGTGTLRPPHKVPTNHS
jgi:hypothetical protein